MVLIFFTIMFLQAFQGKREKIEAKKGESKTPLPYPLRKVGYSGYLCWCLGETFLGPLKMTHEVAFIKRKGLS